MPRKRRTIASSEQEAASTLILPHETVSRCLLSLTQAFGRNLKMTLTTKFRCILGLEAFCAFCTLVVGSFGFAEAPQALRDYEMAAVSAFPPWRAMLCWSVLVVGVLAAPISTIGLFCTWRPARSLFVASRLLVVLSAPLFGLSIEPGLARLFDEAALLCAGCVLGILYLTDIAQSYHSPRASAEP